jgi:hypothetical protein
MPGPLGIGPTKPSAAAPCSIAILASLMELMQHIFTLGNIRLTLMKLENRKIEITKN